MLVPLVLIPACWAQVEVATEVAATLAFTERPTADAESSVYFSEQRNQRLMKLSAAQVSP
jgi:hypothetical protein